MKSYKTLYVVEDIYGYPLAKGVQITTDINQAYKWLIAVEPSPEGYDTRCITVYKNGHVVRLIGYEYLEVCRGIIYKPRRKPQTDTN